MLLVLAFALFLVLIVTWLAAPSATAPRPVPPPASHVLPAMGSHSASA